VRGIVLRITLIGVLVLALGQRGEAQEDQRWSVYETFHGSTNSAGPVFKLDNGVAYGINDHVEVGGGLPLYFVNPSSTSTTLASGTQTGIGNAYVDARFKVTGPALFTSTITGTAPTGNKDKGFSTGRATVDWNNYIAVPMSRITPFGNAGVANTVSDTAFFTRPFTSLGVVGHFEGGATVSVARYVDIGGSVYDIAPTGEQKIISKLIGRTAPVNSNRSGNAFQTSAETVGGADLAKDHGYSAWIELSKGSDINFQLGYTRSAGYDLNSVFFSVGFNVSSLIRKNRS